MIEAALRDTGDLPVLLDRSRAPDLFRAEGLDIDAADIIYLRLKPRESAMVGYVFSGRDREGRPVTLPGYVRTFPNDRSRVLARKWEQKRVRDGQFGAGVRLLEGGRSVLCLFPNDAELSELHKVSDLPRLRRILRGLDLGGRVGRDLRTQTLRYKPERRWIAVVEFKLRRGDGAGRRVRAFVRLFPDARGARIAHLVAAVRARGLGDIVPRPLGSALDGRLYVEEAVEGEELLARMYAGRARPAAVARALHRFHRSGVRTEATVRPIDHLHAARETASTLGRADPALGEAARDVVRRMEALLPRHDETRLIHGDFHPHQVIVGRRSPVLVDFERAARGDPLQDVGNFAARVLARAQREPTARAPLLSFLHLFLKAYLKRNEHRSGADLVYFTLSGLLDAALLPYRRRPPDWQAEVRRILEEARRVDADRLLSEGLDVAEVRRRPWLVLYPKRTGRWPAVRETPSGVHEYGRYDPERADFAVARPETDKGLPHLARWTGRGELVAYRPRRRAVVRLPGPVFAKVLPVAEAREHARRWRLLAAALAAGGAGAPRLPELIASPPGEGILVFACAPGRALHRTLMRGPAAPDIEATGRALARFHALEAGEFGLPRAGGAGGPGRWLELVARGDPDLARRLALTARRLEREPPPPWRGAPRVLHGDLHDRNVFVDRGQVHLIDLDNLGGGDPAADLGNIAAQIVLRALQAGRPPATARPQIALLERAYAAAGGDVDPDAVRAWEARTLFRLACVYAFRGHWRHLSETLRDLV